jgi:UBX domain-containing protein 1
MANVQGVWDNKKGEKAKDKKHEMFTSQGGQSAEGVLRPIRNADPELIEQLLKNAQQQQHGGKGAPKNLGKSIILYKNGFKLGEDGEFRDISDPKNKAFLEEIKQGAIPYELQEQLKKEFGNEQINANEELGVALIDKSKEDYVPPSEPKFQAFKGEAYSLKDNNNNKQNTFINAKPKEMPFNDKEDNIVIQLILHNGEKLRLKMNSSRTVFDLYCHIQHVSKVNSTFDMLAGFPPKLLDNPNQSVKEAGLNGAKVTQKLH